MVRRRVSAVSNHEARNEASSFETRFTARRMALDYLAAYRGLMEKAEPKIRLVSSAE